MAHFQDGILDGLFMGAGLGTLFSAMTGGDPLQGLIGGGLMGAGADMMHNEYANVGHGPSFYPNYQPPGYQPPGDFFFSQNYLPANDPFDNVFGFDDNYGNVNQTVINNFYPGSAQIYSNPTFNPYRPW